MACKMIAVTTSKSGYKHFLFVPKNATTTKLPFLLFLHGAGERGNNLEKIKIHGIPKIIERDPDNFPFITVMPQCPDTTSWRPAQLKILIDEITSTHNVDESRLYCTGISMGGYGTWRLACSFPNLFAAILPICGGGDSTKVDKIKHLPIWNFHGEDDDIVPLTESEQMVNALKKIGSVNVKHTIYPTVKHDSWTITYDNPEIYRWLLQNVK